MDVTDRAGGETSPGGAEPVASPGRLSGRSLALVAAFGLSILLVNFGRPWALTFHEVNFAEPAREFLRSGDWLVPRIMGKPLWDKPPLMHWAIAASMGVFGTEAEWAARLPAALSASATALVVAVLAARWFGERAGVLAGLVQSTTVYAFMQGRLAEADMMLCAAVTAAMGCFAVASGAGGEPSPRRRRLWAVGYFAAAGLAFLAKGPIGPALVAAGSGLFAAVERRSGPWRVLLDPVGWGVMLAIVVAWPAAAAWREPGLPETWWRHNVERFSGRLSGGGKDPFFYLYTSAWLALPWTPIAALGAVACRREGTRRRAGRLLGSWAVGMGLLLSLSAWKHKHYIIPALPPLSIWAAVGLERLVTSPLAARWSRLGYGLGAAALGAVGLAAGVALTESGKGIEAAAALVAGLAGSGLALAAALRRRGRPGAALAAVFGAAWASFVAVHSLAMPGFDDYRGQSDLARRIGGELPEGADLSVVGVPDPQVSYYLPLPVQHHPDDRSLAERLAALPPGSRPVFVVAPRKILGDLKGLGGVRVLGEAATVHPRKGEEDRMIAVELRPDGGRIAGMVRGGGDSARNR
ncbi:ArnT family glycosyltransferase [Tautonia sociabilis]|uniref:Phospholipid carrier-dependent glycosyltransferase n=1 Tax=Tautonia sociabilis TaxID=2080755 RepID=A0A432MD44_9BACT|nr:glycosyltransferase family 39 protein [Tautonia sociabilis]RUL81582.1 phospholipid carrier-dependent glycosyltransferase [Tautonia sociabilis]